MATLAQIGLGSNLGDRKAQLDAAVAALAEAPGVAVRAVSSYQRTEPVGGPAGQDAFLNAAATLETALAQSVRPAEEVFRRLVAELAADEVYQGKEPVEWAYRWETRQRRDRVQQRFVERFEQHGRDLDARHWTAERSGDRWLVTDFWF